MNFNDTIDTLKESYPIFQLGSSFLIIFLFFVLRRVLSRIVLKRAQTFNFDEGRAIFIKKTVVVAIATMAFVLLGMTWDISLKGLSVYFASFITIVGVGLFATWSMVSNITASVILFFFFPIKIGSKIKIMDGDNSAEGIVESLSLFSIRIMRDDGHEVYYPNNLALQKSIVHLEG